MVKKVSGVDFAVREAPRRAGDPPAIVAGAEKVRKVLGWQPAHADLEEIVSSAYAWENYLRTRNRRDSNADA
jgi:UDP-glucose 4-epimerase